MAVKIIITEDGTPTSVANASGGGGAGTGTRAKDQEQGKEKGAQGSLNTLLIDYTKQIATQCINTSIEFSGNYIYQDRLTNLTNIGGDALMIAKGGWIGAIAVATKYGTQAFNNIIELNREKAKVDMLRKQSGNVIELGGRYTND